MITAVLFAALGGALLIGGPPRDRLVVRSGSRRAYAALRVPMPVLVPAVAALAGAALHPPIGMLALAAAIASATVWFLIRGHARRRRDREAVRECARAARVLSSLLLAGQIPSVALADAATDCPVLASTAAAARLGGDVGGELERCARRPGREPLMAISAAWRLSERTGAPIAEILAGVADTLRREQQVGALVEAELAAARASGHIMAALPFLAVGLGFTVGVNPIAFLTGEPLGQILAVVGVALTAAGVLWIDALSRTQGCSR